jgi:hypothetical protein
MGGKKTSKLIETAAEILRRYHPTTVRQVYYQLVSRQVIENSRWSHPSVPKALVTTRRDEAVIVLIRRAQPGDLVH